MTAQYYFGKEIARDLWQSMVNPYCSSVLTRMRLEKRLACCYNRTDAQSFVRCVFHRSMPKACNECDIELHAESCMFCHGYYSSVIMESHDGNAVRQAWKKRTRSRCFCKSSESPDCGPECDKLKRGTTKTGPR